MELCEFFLSAIGFRSCSIWGFLVLVALRSQHADPSSVLSLSQQCYGKLECGAHVPLLSPSKGELQVGLFPGLWSSVSLGQN